MNKLVNEKEEAFKAGKINKFCFECGFCILSENDEIICEETEIFIEPYDEEPVYYNIDDLVECPLNKWTADNISRDGDLNG